ncbi:hypothetical protein B0A55_08154 [Friedmanniomyces simplex]|uniref:Uncharacterized protein n=1 Tax=Friedmanniomyces simplex TaxID=329884 RepID=A0A4V5NGH5_9PEZI|nr:hypothetical protein B0A55_08154 [Friedmanniomyces simplex]
MASSHQIQNALLTEHFRYTPLTLLDDIINNVNELVYRAINAIDEGLAAIPPAALGFTLTAAQVDSLPTEEGRQDALDELKATELGNGCVQLESLLNSTVDKDFDKFEIYTLRNILALGHDEKEARGLAEFVVLDHYKHVDVKGLEGTPTPEEVQMQRRKVQETKKLNATLKVEEAKNAAMLKQLGGLLGAPKNDASPAGQASQSPFAFLTASPHTAATSSTTDSQPLTQNVHYALAQLPALRDLVAELKGSLQTLPNARHAPPHDPDSAEGKRRQYLDTQSRRAVQRKGITSSNGESSQQTAAVGAGTGRRIGRDEVEGMEAVVQALGGASARRQSDADDDVEMGG